MKRIINYLHLRETGSLEILFALAPLLGGFGLWGIPLSSLIWVILLTITITRGKTRGTDLFKPILFFVLYWLIHELIIAIVDKVSLFGIISNMVYFVVIIFLYSRINIRKLIGSLNWVAIIVIMGLLYQWLIIVGGGVVHPLEIPGLTMSETRLLREMVRPSSFFMEPQACVSFMIFPLAFSLIERKYIWTVILILSIFLTTSTTGLVVSFVLLGMSIFGTGKFKLYRTLFILLIGAGLFYALTNIEAFQYGVDKFENTDIEQNIRLVQGPYIVSTMTSGEMIFGAPYGSAYRYCLVRAHNVVFYGESVFMSTFWLMILRFGIVGLVLYLNVYYQLLRKTRLIMPLVVCIIAMLFSNPDGIGSTYTFSLILLLCIANNERILSNLNK